MGAMTTTPPTKPGWYWAWMVDKKMAVCEVSNRGGHLFAYWRDPGHVFGMTFANVKSKKLQGTLWSTEPIEPPGESDE